MSTRDTMATLCGIPADMIFKDDLHHDMSGYKPPFLRDGAHYGADHNGREVSRGARMGRSTLVDASRYDGSKLRLVQVAIDSQGYDMGGAYWGHWREPLWCAFVQGGAIEIFTCAKDRLTAKKNVRAVLCAHWWGDKPMPSIDFYR